MKKYDVIGDIHGHADELMALLKKMGYQEEGKGFSHNDRQVVFLGDFVDENKELGQHRQVMDIVMAMTISGNAHAVMGNHEYNALAWHFEYQGDHLRTHNQTHEKQHVNFLKDYEQHPIEKLKVLEFFRSLPLWLELDGVRAVHACWSEKDMDILAPLLSNNCITDEALIATHEKGSEEKEALQVVLKGPEVKLPDGVSYHDHRGTERFKSRIAWWKRDIKKLKDQLMVPLQAEAALEGHPLVENPYAYSRDEKPCFIGHYWMKGQPRVLATNLACVDYSVAGNGRLTAYRWDGENVLDNSKFVS